MRDLLFHRFENEYDLIYIQQLLNTLDAKLLGLEQADQTIYQQFSSQNPDVSSFQDLSLWHRFELEHPDTFKDDYVVWLQKQL